MIFYHMIKGVIFYHMVKGVIFYHMVKKTHIVKNDLLSY